MFNETKGLEIYQQIEKQGKQMLEDRQYISLASLYSLYSYFLTGEEFFMDLSKLTLMHYDIKDHLVITNDTARSLELILNNVDESSNSSLFSLFKCETYGGRTFGSHQRECYEHFCCSRKCLRFKSFEDK